MRFNFYFEKVLLFVKILENWENVLFIVYNLLYDNLCSKQFK